MRLQVQLLSYSFTSKLTSINKTKQSIKNMCHEKDPLPDFVFVLARFI
jgi:hypothetical protein